VVDYVVKTGRLKWTKKEKEEKEAERNAGRTGDEEGQQGERGRARGRTRVRRNEGEDDRKAHRGRQDATIQRKERGPKKQKSYGRLNDQKHKERQVDKGQKRKEVRRTYQSN
jgi:hypothetical protein